MEAVNSVSDVSTWHMPTGSAMGVLSVNLRPDIGEEHGRATGICPDKATARENHNLRVRQEAGRAA